MAEKPPEKSRMLLSMVALDTPSLPAAAGNAGNLGFLVGHDRRRRRRSRPRKAAWSFSLGGNTAAVALMPAPIPWSNLEGPCETAWWWPEAGGKNAGP